jgi:MFS family permease
MSLRSLMVDRRPLAIPDYRRLWTASVVTAIGGSFSLVAVPARLFTMSGSSAAVGTAASISLVTLIVSALWSGVLADRMDRRTILVTANAVLAAAYAGFAVAGSVTVMLGLVGVQGLAFGAVMATMGAAVPRVVPRELLPAASSLSSLVRQTGSIAGPLLAGALLPVTGARPLFLCDAVALLAVIWAILRLPEMRPAAAAKHEPMLRQLGQGFVYLSRQRVLMAVLAVDLAAMVFSFPFALYPELAERVYGGPPGGGSILGLLYAAYPAGVFAAGLFSGSFTRARRLGALMAGAGIAWGFIVMLLGAASTAWLGALALVAGGAVNFVLSTSRNAISQAYTDDALLGRIQGVLVVVLMGGPQLAGLLHGYGGALVGARVAIAVGGLLTVVSIILVVRLAPALWNYTVATEVPQQREPDSVPIATLRTQPSAVPPAHPGGTKPRQR